MITIYGSSDDLIEVEGDIEDEYYTSADDTWEADLVAPGGTGQMRVTFWYRSSGTWHAAIGQTDESVPLPDWGNGIGQHKNGYSAELRIDAPAGTRLTSVAPPPQE